MLKTKAKFGAWYDVMPRNRLDPFLQPWH